MALLFSEGFSCALELVLVGCLQLFVQYVCHYELCNIRAFWVELVKPCFLICVEFRFCRHCVVNAL